VTVTVVGGVVVVQFVVVDPMHPFATLWTAVVPDGNVGASWTSTSTVTV
jgi:hypothetical protein